MDKILKLYTYVDGENDIPFPQGAEEPIEICAFRYDAKRMGGAPTITASVNYPTCLDDEWTDKVYASFNGEKYYLRQTPTSSYNNESTMYKHDLELVSERVILDNVYFFDVVTGNPQGDDKPVSNSTKVVFFGNIHEFVSRLNSSLEYSHLDYEVVVDNDDAITTEEKLMSFEDQFFSNVLQEIYNTYKVPYYFEGKTIHIGYSNKNDIIPTLEYGVDNALLSITKNNANYKIVNRATATGSSDNIPFYYPNNSPKGNIVAEESEDSQLGVEIFDYELFADKVAIGGVITYQAAEADITKVTDSLGNLVSSDNNSLIAEFGYKGYSTKYKMYITSYIDGVIPLTLTPLLDFTRYDNKEDAEGSTARGTTSIRIFSEGKQLGKSEVNSLGHTFDISLPRGMSLLEIHVSFTPEYNSSTNWFEGSVGLSWATDSVEGWYYEGEEVVLKDLGLSITKEYPYTGDSITLRQTNYVKTSQNLMPSIYRKTGGKERFYNAVDGLVDENDNEITFNNPYVEGHPKEHIITVEDIKPTIKEATNGVSWVETDEEGATKTVYQRMDMFSEFAYDLDDNDETVENEEGSEREYVHSYFFAKLRKLDFNLFDHAIENQPMTISFTSGPCGACNFEIGVTEEFPQKNPVQVNADGTLKRDKKGRVICGQFEDITEDECQPEQQDTINNEVWIALKKEDTTYGILMPKATIYEKDEDGNIEYDENGEAVVKEAGHRPKACSGKHSNDGDTFVILGIHLPESYIINAEKKLEAEIIKYLKDNNDEKFTFSIGFSRIYFEENDIHNHLSENSKIKIVYDGKPYELYVTSFSYSMSEGDVLPEIRVELDNTLKVSQNALQNAISQVKSELGRVIGSLDVVGIATPYFIRKDADDEANGTVNFKKGIKFGEGGKVEVLDNNSAKLTIEYLEVTKKASFTSLEIQEKTHVGGQILVTPAAVNCGEVEELADAYRCYFQTQGVDGDEIFNQFAVGDQAICQTYNAWGSKYYWRLVTGIGEDYIDLSKTECDEDSDAPSEGDKIIQLGNQIDEARQNAIVIAAYGDGSPYIIQYKGIDAFELPEDKIVTKLSSTENIFTGKVHMEMGSDGLENINGGLNIGGQNLLRNSGFTGDYLSETLADKEVMDASKELFSDPLDHWKDDNEEDGIETGSVGAEVIALEGISASGYGVRIHDVTNEDGTTIPAMLTQALYYDLIGGETYTLSFKAKGSVLGEGVNEETGETIFVYNTIECNVGDYSETLTLTDEWAKYEVRAKITNTSKAFSLVGNGVTLCDIQLERGTIATAWGMSPLDNSSDRTYYESIKYLSQSMAQEAMTEGATDVLGGLILTNHIKVGNYANQEMLEETGGMNGTYTDENSVAFWAGGDFDTAENTVGKYTTNTTTPSGEIPFAVTHGGRVVLNDAVVRGAVHATSGRFGDLTIGKYQPICGAADSFDSVHSSNTHTSGEYAYSTVVKFSSGSISAACSYMDGYSCYAGNSLIIDADADASKNANQSVLFVRGENMDAIKVGRGDIVLEYGKFRGLSVPTKVVTSDYTANREEASVIIADTSSGSCEITLLGNAVDDGAILEIHKTTDTYPLVLAADACKLHYQGQDETQHTVDEGHYIRLVYVHEKRTWYTVIV